MRTFDDLRCIVCGTPWSEHSPDCPRHDHRPGASTVEAVSSSSPCADGELLALLRRLAAELERSGWMPDLRAALPAPWWVVSEAISHIEQLRSKVPHLENTIACAPDPQAASAVAELDRLRAALDRIAREAVVPIAGRLDRWEWAVGRVCSCTYFTRDEARAGFRRRFGLEEN